MPDYNKGKIYKIECLTTGLIYVGSTTKDYLSQRLTKHKHHYTEYLNSNKRYMTSFEILKNNNYRIYLLEEVNCENKEQLLAREGHYIRTLECVNRCINGRTQQQYRDENKERFKQRYIDNIDKHKQYYENNKEHKLKKVKEYYETNKEKIKEYRETRKEDIRQKRAEKFNCPCGLEIQRGNQARHNKTKKHHAYLETINN